MSDSGLVGYLSNYLSNKDQVRHYFNRPHEAVATKPIDCPSAWVSKDLPSLEDLIYVFTSRDIAEIEAAIAAAKSTGKSTRDLLKTDFPLPGLTEKISDWAEVLGQGLGFQLLRGIPVERWAQQDSECFFWCFGLHLGIPGAQNPDGDLLGHVINLGVANQNDMVRLYKTSADIAYHCDAADVVGLLCLNKAKSGGKSRFVSSVSVFNRLLSESPEMAVRLFEPVMLDRRGETGRDGFPYSLVEPCRYSEGQLKTFYHSDYFRSVQRHAEAPRFTALEQAMIDRYEAIASDPELYLDMDLQPGDIQLLSNHTHLHARTEYEDHQDPALKRHLLRLWLSL